MPKFSVYAIASASKYLGDFEADTKEEAIDKALEENPPHASLCWQCSKEIDLGDFYEEQAEEATS